MRLTQARWRAVGIVAIAACSIMAWCGVEWQTLRHSTPLFFAYWAAFFVLLGVALYVAILDLRYIRVQYSLGSRRIFQETVGNEEFRQALRAAHESARRTRSPQPVDSCPRRDDRLN